MPQKNNLPTFYTNTDSCFAICTFHHHIYTYSATEYMWRPTETAPQLFKASVFKNHNTELSFLLSSSLWISLCAHGSPPPNLYLIN